MIRSIFSKYKYCVSRIEDVLKSFKNTLSTFTFFFHSCVETFLKSTRRAAAPIIAVHCTIVISSARVRSAVTNRAFKEAFTTFACAHSIVFPRRFVPAHSTVEFVLWLNFGKINDGWISTGSHVALRWDNDRMCTYRALVWKPGE